VRQPPELGVGERARARLLPLERYCPEVAAEIDAGLQEPLRAYAARLFRPVPPPATRHARAARAHFLSELRAAVEAVAPGAAAAAEREFLARPVIQSASHCQLLLDRSSFYAALVSRMGVLATAGSFLVSYQCATNTLESRPGKGPGWVSAGDARFNVFGLSRRRLARSSVCGVAGPLRLVLQPAGDGRGASAPGYEYVRRVGAGLAGRVFQNAPEAFAAANQALWSRWDHGGRTRLITFTDEMSGRVLCRHLEDEESPIGRLLLEPRRREALRQALRREAEQVAPFLTLGTDHFWLLREGRIRRLREREGRLEERDGGDGFRLPLERRAILDGLRGGRLVPNLFWHFMVAGIVPQFRMLGGQHQICYYPAFRRAAIAALGPAEDEAALRSELAACRREHGWILHVIEDAEHPADVLARLEEGRQLEALDRAFGGCSLGQASGWASVFETDPKWRERSFFHRDGKRTSPA